MYSQARSRECGKRISRLTVVTVCLNCADTIALTLDNVRSQSYHDVEHVVIDGGSTDGTAEIIRSFGVDYFVSEPDGGIYQAMTKGIAAATGDVLVFLNSADVFHDNRVAADVVRYFNQTGSDIIFGDFVPYLVNPDDQYEHPCFQADVVCSNAGVTSRVCLRDRNIHHQAVFYHRDVFQTCSFFSPELPNGNDYELNVQALVRDGYPAKYFQRTVTKFALGGVTTSNAAKEEQEYGDVIELMRKKYFSTQLDFSENEYTHTPSVAARRYPTLWNRVRRRLPRLGRPTPAVQEQDRTNWQEHARSLEQLVGPLKNKIQMLEKDAGQQQAKLAAVCGLLEAMGGKLDGICNHAVEHQTLLGKLQNHLQHLSNQHERQSAAFENNQSKLLEHSLDASGYYYPRERGYGISSQFDEDGLIQFLVRNIEIPNKVFVEFGVENYREANTRLLLRKENWQGLVMDGSESDINQIQKSDLYWRHNLQAKTAFVTSENINELIESADITGDIGLLSIDIDGVDYWVWDAISVIRPRIVVCEYNSIFGMKAKVTVPNEPDFDRRKKHFSWLYAGASLAALTELADRKGYRLVASNCAGNNAFFVRSDVMGSLEPLCVTDAYVKAKFRESRDEEGKLSYLTIEQGVKLLADLPVIETETGREVLIKDIDCQYEKPLSNESIAAA